MNSAYRVNEAKKNRHDLFPISKDESRGLYVLEIKESPSPLAKTVGVIVDMSIQALNITEIRTKVEKKRKEYLVKILKRPGDIAYKRKQEASLMNELLRLARVYEQQGEVKIELYDGE